MKGDFPTILLENQETIQCFNAPNLNSIAQQLIDKYKETNFNFLKRLTEQFGEWLFFDGQQAIFGKHNGQEITLNHITDQLPFNIEMKIQPNNQQLSGYDFRQHIVLEDNTHAIAVSLDIYTSYTSVRRKTIHAIKKKYKNK